MDIAVEQAPNNRRDLSRVKTGALRFYKGELGAKPTARGMKKKKPVELAQLDPKMLSEIVFGAMLMTDVGECVGEMPFEDYRHPKHDLEQTFAQFDQRTSNAMAINRQRVDLLKEWISQLPQGGRNGPTQARVSIEGDWLKIVGKVNTYQMHLTTGRLRSDDRSKRVYISNEPEEPSDDIFIAHAGDERFLKMLASIEHLLKDDRPGPKKIRIG
jgi:hypothetical protein